MFMHSGIKKAPILPATRLVNGCYSMMFDACNDLTYVKCYATSCEKNDWEGCVGWGWIHQHDTKNGTFVCKKVNGGKNPIEEWIPDAWSVEYLD
jgi:hypothetical protein